MAGHIHVLPDQIQAYPFRQFTLPPHFSLHLSPHIFSKAQAIDIEGVTAERHRGALLCTDIHDILSG